MLGTINTSMGRIPLRDLNGAAPYRDFVRQRAVARMLRAIGLELKRSAKKRTWVRCQ